jgi:uncharacterized protein YkwD
MNPMCCPRMKTYPYMKVIAVACMGALVSCATSPKPQKMSVSASPRPSSSLSGQVLQEVNSYRRSHGKSELQRHPGLDRLAQEHCEYLRKHRGTFGLNGGNVSHYGFESRAINARERYQMGAVSENVAAATHPGKSAAPLLVKLWSQSKSHDANMRNSWTHTGVGVVVDHDGMVFATELFGCINHSQLTTRNRFNGQ